MRGTVAIVALSAALASCGSARAAPPDSQNPAHCMASFSYAAYKFNSVNKTDQADQMMARGVFELERAVASGKTRSEAIAESKAFAQAFIRDDNQKQIGKLFIACGEAEEADPRFESEVQKILARAPWRKTSL